MKFTKSSAVLASVITAFLCCEGQNSSTNIVYDASHDFSLAANPNGVWSYGWKPSLAGVFTLFTIAGTGTFQNGVPVQMWEFGNGTYLPAVLYNATTNTGLEPTDQGTFPPGTLYFVPGYDGSPQNFCVIRFTVPDRGAGAYRLESAVRCYLDGDNSGDTDYHVVVNGGEVFDEFLAPRSATGYTNVLSLAVGDSVDFMVGRGADGHLYASGLKIQATLSRPATCAPYRATATATLDNGFLVKINITDGGCGYTNNPLPVVLIRDASGTGATAHAVVTNGVVASIVIDDAGKNYSTNTVVLIAPPPFFPTLSISVKTVSVQMSVVIGRKYELDVSTDMMSWTPVEPPFVAQDDTITQEFDVTNTGRFFRIVEVP
jgi:hypothetical protein